MCVKFEYQENSTQDYFKNKCFPVLSSENQLYILTFIYLKPHQFQSILINLASNVHADNTSLFCTGGWQGSHGRTTESGSDPSTFLTPLDLDTRNSSSMS